MSLIVQEIKHCLLGLADAGNGKIMASFKFPASFIGFKGHFPQQPVLPGICQIQAALAIAEQLHKTRVKLTKIVSAKFFEPVSQGEELKFEYSEIWQPDNQVLLKVLVSGQGRKIAKLDLEVILTSPTS